MYKYKLKENNSNSVLGDLKNTFKDIEPGETKTFSFNLTSDNINEKKQSVSEIIAPRTQGELAEGSALYNMFKMLKEKNFDVEWRSDIYKEFQERKATIERAIEKKQKEGKITPEQIKETRDSVKKELSTGKNLAEAFVKQLEEEVKDAQFCKVKLEWIGPEGGKADVRITVTKPETKEMVSTFLNSS